MRVARRFGDGEAVEVTKHKKMKPADHATRRDLRIRRDLVWLMLARIGLTPTEIEETCHYAARSRRQIRKRLVDLKSRHPAATQAEIGRRLIESQPRSRMAAARDAQRDTSPPCPPGPQPRQTIFDRNRGWAILAATMKRA